jgi:hypothetical protein
MDLQEMDGVIARKKADLKKLREVLESKVSRGQGWEATGIRQGIADTERLILRLEQERRQNTPLDGRPDNSGSYSRGSMFYGSNH